MEADKINQEVVLISNDIPVLKPFPPKLKHRCKRENKRKVKLNTATKKETLIVTQAVKVNEKHNKCVINIDTHVRCRRKKIIGNTLDNFMNKAKLKNYEIQLHSNVNKNISRNCKRRLRHRKIVKEKHHHHRKEHNKTHIDAKKTKSQIHQSCKKLTKKREFDKALFMSSDNILKESLKDRSVPKCQRRLCEIVELKRRHFIKNSEHSKFSKRQLEDIIKSSLRNECSQRHTHRHKYDKNVSQSHSRENFDLSPVSSKAFSDDDFDVLSNYTCKLDTLIKRTKEREKVVGKMYYKNTKNIRNNDFDKTMYEEINSDEEFVYDCIDGLCDDEMSNGSDGSYDHISITREKESDTIFSDEMDISIHSDVTLLLEDNGVKDTHVYSPTMTPETLTFDMNEHTEQYYVKSEIYSPNQEIYDSNMKCFDYASWNYRTNEKLLNASEIFKTEAKCNLSNNFFIDNKYDERIKTNKNLEYRDIDDTNALSSVKLKQEFTEVNETETENILNKVKEEPPDGIKTPIIFILKPERQALEYIDDNKNNDSPFSIKKEKLTMTHEILLTSL